VSAPEETELDPAVFDAVGRRVGRQIGAGTAPPDGRGMRVGLACSRFNGGITGRLLEGALGGLAECAVDRADTTVAWVPGAFELPLAAQRLAGGNDAVVCLGAVIRGDTAHFDLVAGECAAGLARVALSTGVPVLFGVLTTDTVAQALERSAADDANKGREAAWGAVQMVAVLRELGPARAEAGA
jgi:6,7-dimethyl-8-ribityllumazine synthase